MSGCESLWKEFEVENERNVIRNVRILGPISGDRYRGTRDFRQVGFWKAYWRQCSISSKDMRKAARKVKPRVLNCTELFHLYCMEGRI